MKEIIDLKTIKVIDDHCHYFLPKYEKKEFEKYWNLSRFTIESKHLKNYLGYRFVIRELGRLLFNNVEEDEKRILTERNKIYHEDPQYYIKRLFSDAGIEALLIDTGVPNKRNYGYTIELDDFSRMLPNDVAIGSVVRVEPIIDEIFDRSYQHFYQFIDAFESQLKDEIETKNAVALKTAIAYETGIKINNVDQSEAESAYTKYLKKREKSDEKTLRDFIVNLSLEKCIEYHIPMQIHTGIGDAPVLDLRCSNPTLLQDIFVNEKFRKVDFIILHGGYPFLAETASLVNMYPNVWVDISEMIPFASLGVKKNIGTLLEMAPITKILYGSDGYYIPEIYWFSAIFFKKEFAKFLEKLVSEKMISCDYGVYVAKRILSENAREVYKIK